MRNFATVPVLVALILSALAGAPASAQHEQHGAPAAAADSAAHPHEMWMAELGGGWRLMAMGQLFPVVTVGAPGEEDSAFRETGWYLTQPVAMADVVSGGGNWVLRVTLDLEGLTLEDGELTFGGWGEGFIDKRHPHTLLHEAMLSWKTGQAGGNAFSLSAGKGFAPYGTDDPMSRPGLKYPTNHHLSQILERFTVNAAVLLGRWSLEAGVFGGGEPEGPYDFSNIESFADSWSARVGVRWGEGSGPAAEWEATASYGNVAEEHHGELERTGLANVALRHARSTHTGGLYALAEASRSDPEEGEGHFSVLGETRLEAGGHAPYVRLEYATRPEYEREGPAGTDDFFRYHHGSEAVGATRWLITTLGYGYEATDLPVSVRPFVEAQHHRVRAERGGIDPASLFGTDSFWSVSLGARLFFGGGPMRMGAYGVLDPMVADGGAAHDAPAAHH